MLLSLCILINKHMGKAKASCTFYAAACLSQSLFSACQASSSQHFDSLKKALKDFLGLLLMSSSAYKEDSYT